MPRHLSLIIRFALISAMFFFLGKTLLANWQEVKDLELQGNAWLFGTAALGIAIAAQVWIAFVWGWILETLQNPVPQKWSITTCLKNNPAKYIPGNFWHMVGRFKAAQEKGLSLDSVALSVLLEPMLIIGGALLLSLLNTSYTGLKGLGLGLMLMGLHPWGINYLWKTYRKFQGKDISSVGMERYPFRELVGSTFFMALRSLTFLCAVGVFTPISLETLRPLLGGFSLAWILSLITPVPAGIGVFEVSAVTTLDGYLSPASLLGAVAVYRLVSILAEAIGAGGAFLVKEAPDGSS
jgi:glycosyltransferase 2 family protein